VEPAAVVALDRATDLLHAVQGPGGWGYNRHTATDADSTAWTCRALAVLDARREVDLVPLLNGFVSSDGTARTFRDRERFGSWGCPHADVTALVGSALVAAGAPRPLVAAVRNASVRACEKGGWAGFWWATATYATARNVEFLTLSGGCPEAVLSRVDWHPAVGVESTIEAAHRVMLATLAPAPEVRATGNLVRDLLERQEADGGWASSPDLLVPPQHGAGPATVHADERRVFGTAMAVEAVKGWLLRR
jgi:hypothetical protein